jgi:hypothetical protein
MSMDPKSVALDALTKLNNAEKKDVTVAYMHQLGTTDQRDVVQQVSPLPSPDTITVNFIWRVVVSAFVLALLVAVAILAINAVTQKPTAEVLITIFTTAVGFLAGLLTPSPAQTKQSISGS